MIYKCFRKSALILPLIVLFLLPVMASAQDAYRIEIRISELPDTTMYLANYYGDKTYMADTAQSDARGLAVFTGKEALPGGIYILAVSRNRVLEFIVDKDQHFRLEADGPDFVENLKVTGSDENTLFFDYMRFNTAKYKEVQPLQSELKDLEEGSERYEEIRDQLDLINKEVEDYKTRIITDHPATFLATFFKAMRDPEVPDPPVLENGKEDSTFAYRYYKRHFWDNVDLSDERLLRTPILHPRLDRYFDKVLLQHADTLIAAIDGVIARSRPNKEMFKYLVWYLTIKYETSKVMGFDKIFVHMVDAYYSTDEADWVNETVKANIKERADKLRPILVGNKAPNMIMLDTNRIPISMYNVPAKYTILYFWDPDCGHCKKETPKLKALYEEHGKSMGIEVFAVCSDTSYAEMKSYIRKIGTRWINVNGPRTLTGDYHDAYDIYSTPVIYILDEQKVIIAKRLQVDQIRDFILRYEEMKARLEEKDRE